ncbi:MULTISPECIES: hypothetical protein [Hymenobacter]|uniref:Uncharacterized protein n=1 Tax=Hymenobacter mucosus TaxID=1411120 RepID=A0A238YMA7_9BACT|nr:MULTISPECIES: hypothetical protein [Hymenobacter]SNR71753.1 hypothetical protein SAMN06269173_105335 [Hymenobacter mucosus]
MQTIFRLLSGLVLGVTLLTACKPNLEEQLQNPRVGDVYVVQFQPVNTQLQRYYFYQVAAVRPDAVDLHPARQEATDAQASTAAPNFFSDNTLTYTRAEALELLQEQPGDVQHTRLVQVRSAD